MPKGPITSRPLIKDTDPKYKAGQKRYYEANKERRQKMMKEYYIKNQERLRARRMERYYEEKAKKMAAANKIENEVGDIKYEE